MSDGALSQDEIDALLAGVDSSGLGGMMSAPAAPMDTGVADANSKTLKTLFTAFLRSLTATENSSATTEARIPRMAPRT